MPYPPARGSKVQLNQYCSARALCAWKRRIFTKQVIFQNYNFLQASSDLKEIEIKTDGWFKVSRPCYSLFFKRNIHTITLKGQLCTFLTFFVGYQFLTYLQDSTCFLISLFNMQKCDSWCPCIFSPVSLNSFTINPQFDPLTLNLITACI